MASSARVHRVLELAADLSREERQEVAAELLAALEPGTDLDEEAWNVIWREELERRASDTAPCIPWEDARGRIDARLAEIRSESRRR
jgi:hypothetical protein